MVLIRKARKDDAKSLARLHRGEGWCYDDEVIISDYWDDAFDKESIFVAEINGLVVGTIELVKAYKARFGYFGVIRRFVIDPEYRGVGIGKKLISYALTEAKKLGCNAVELSVDPQNDIAHKFYKSLDFRDDRTEIIMVKLLQ